MIRGSSEITVNHELHHCPNMETGIRTLETNKLTHMGFCSNFHDKLQTLRRIFKGSIPKTLPGPERGAAVIIALLLQPQELCELCAVGYCFFYKELSDLATFPRSHMKAFQSSRCVEVPG